MIPTRVNQQFYHGTVSGFNPATGSIVVFSNTAYYSESVSAAKFAQYYYESTCNFPKGYKWPTASDFQLLLGSFVSETTLVDGELYTLELDIPTMPLSFKNYVQKLLGQQSEYSTWVAFDENFKLGSCHAFVEIILSEGFEEFLCEIQPYTARSTREGYLVPVLRINGSNVDLVDQEVRCVAREM